MKRESEDTVTSVSLFCESAEAGTAGGIELSSATEEVKSRVVHVALKRKHLNHISSLSVISVGNYTVREVLMKNRTRVWQNVYNTASA